MVENYSKSLILGWFFTNMKNFCEIIMMNCFVQKFVKLNVDKVSWIFRKTWKRYWDSFEDYTRFCNKVGICHTYSYSWMLFLVIWCYVILDANFSLFSFDSLLLRSQIAVAEFVPSAEASKERRRCSEGQSRTWWCHGRHFEWE